MSQVFLASRNPKKLEELRRILADVVPDIEVLGLDDVTPYDEPAETEPTFEGNALLKARAGVEATGLPSLADDSGLCVDALNGMPGVLSARWAGVAKDDAANNRLLLEQLADVPDDRRGAEFRCAVAFCRPGGDEDVVFGEMRGAVIREQRGSGGFGYDVVFVPDGETRTSAEMPAAEKDLISHRGKSLRAVAPLVAAALGLSRLRPRVLGTGGSTRTHSSGGFVSTDAIVLLKNDHKEIRKVFRDFEAAGESARKRRGQLVDKMLELLTVHTYIENECMYPRMRELVPELEDDVLESYEEHHVADVLCMELAAMSS